MNNNESKAILRHELQIAVRLIFYFWFVACLFYIAGYEK